MRDDVSQHFHMPVWSRLRSSLLSYSNPCQFWLRWMLLSPNITYGVAYTTVHLYVVGCVLLCPNLLTCLFARDSALPLWAIQIPASFDLKWVLLCPNITYGVAYTTVHLSVVACVLLCPNVLTCLFARDCALPLYTIQFLPVLTWDECCFVRTLLMELPTPWFTWLSWDVFCCVRTFSHVCSLATPLFLSKLFEFLPVLLCAFVSQHFHMCVRLRLRSSLVNYSKSCQSLLRWELLCPNITYGVAYNTVHSLVVGCVLLCPNILTCLLARASALPL